jgi:hypothetical protein
LAASTTAPISPGCRSMWPQALASPSFATLHFHPCPTCLSRARPFLREHLTPAQVASLAFPP